MSKCDICKTQILDKNYFYFAIGKTELFSHVDCFASEIRKLALEDYGIEDYQK